MGDTVFWSWQNDLPKRENRTFLREALAAAIKRVNAGLAIDEPDGEADRIALDHATKDTPGMADISRTILDKIKTCAVTVADVTPIARSEKDKALPNPNVMVELGYAMHAIGEGRVIAVLNMAHGRIEELPFDIRNRRVMTYELPAEAPKTQRKEKRETLIRELAKAIEQNIAEVRESRSAAEPIEGVESDPNAPGLWKADWPLKHRDSRDRLTLRYTVASVRPLDLARAWIRIIPAGYTKGIPSVAEVDGLPLHVRLWVPIGIGMEKNWSFGPYPFGYVRYRIANYDDDETVRADNITVYLKETGEVWMSEGFTTRQNPEKQIEYDRLFKNWIWGMEAGMDFLDALGALKRQRVILGIEGMTDTIWVDNPDHRFPWTGEPGFTIDETASDWPQDRRREFLNRAYNKLLDAFAIPRVDREGFDRRFERTFSQSP